ncbi:MAG: hypothetical protein EOO65_05740 [Methanosarcinales archaeon]|nr:MAG: hypothetical protein EOO65_05740 [Methanosarcinales archaeon]
MAGRRHPTSARVRDDSTRPPAAEGNRTEPNNYLLVLCRLELEHAVETKCVLYDQQAGFRPGREGLPTHQVAFLHTLAATSAKREGAVAMGSLHRLRESLRPCTT